MRFKITKCHGSGNDFAMLDSRGIVLDEAGWASVAQALANRNGPVGGDGMLAMTAGGAGHAFGFRMWNSDGSEAETCLNGLRCVARAGFETFSIERAAVRLKTSSAIVARDRAIAPGVTTIREVAGPADLDVSRWPLGEEARIVEAPIAQLGSARAFTAIAIPNPHLVSFVEAINDDELTRIGERCEAAPDWLPNRANVSFVQLRGADLFVRTHERGVGLTDSCGSAMAASTYAACLTGRATFGRELTVFNRGGLVKAQAESGGMVRLSGNATFCWTGEIDVTDGVASGLTITERFTDDVAAWDGVLAGLAD